MTRLVKIGTRFVAPPIFEAACLAQTKYLKDLIGDVFHHYIMKYDGVRMDTIRSEEDLEKLKPLMLAYAGSDKFKQNIKVCEDLIKEFKEQLNKKDIPELIDSFARLYVHNLVPSFVSNVWSPDEKTIDLCQKYREMIDVVLLPFQIATEHMPIKDSFIFYSGKYVDMPWEEFLKKNDFEYIEEKSSGVKEIKGSVVYKGNVKGVAKVIFSPKDFYKFNEGDILVAPMTTALYVPIMHKAVGIVTDEGGVTCHAAIIAREMKKPCIISTKNATQNIKDGDLIEIDGEKGVVRII